MQRLTEQEQRVADLIAKREGDLLDNLKLHVGLPTGGFNKEALDETRELFASRLGKLGASFEIVKGKPKPAWLSGGDFSGHTPPTAICRRLGGATSGRVLLAGHLDTVHDPGGDFKELTVHSDGRLATGPGCVDMKGGLVIAVAALEALEEAGVPAAWSFLMNSDEESGSFHSDQALRDEAPKHDFGLALEPAMPGGELVIERMGSGQFMLEVHGKSAHVGRAFDDGVSAVTKLGELLVEVGKMPCTETGRILNIGPINGGVVSNAVPDRAMAWGNVRYVTPAVGEQIKNLLAELGTDDDAMPRVIVRTALNRPAKPLKPETESLGHRARQVAEALGQKLPFASTGGVCDGNILQDAGLPTIDTLGVRGGGLHTPDEWIDLTSLVERCQLLAILIARLSGGRQ